MGTVLGLPLAWYFLSNGYEPSVVYNEDRLSTFFTTYFFVYLLLDLSLGMLYYPKYIDPLSGWFHHVIFAILIASLKVHHSCNAMMFCYIQELPTFLLAVGSIHKPYRQDLLFGITFFITRVCYHIAYASGLISHYQYNHPAALYSAFFGVLTTIMHVMWFSQWLRKLPQYLQAQQRTKEGKVE